MLILFCCNRSFFVITWCAICIFFNEKSTPSRKQLGQSMLYFLLHRSWTSSVLSNRWFFFLLLSLSNCFPFWSSCPTVHFLFSGYSSELWMKYLVHTLAFFFLPKHVSPNQKYEPIVFINVGPMMVANCHRTMPLFFRNCTHRPNC